MGGLNRDRWVRVVVLGTLLAVAVWLPFVLPSHRVFRLTLVLVHAVAVLGLGLATGFNGQVSLGHGAFFAVGARRRDPARPGTVREDALAARAPGIAYGTLVIIVLLVAPGGIAGLGRRLRERFAPGGPPRLSGPRAPQRPAG